MVSKMHACIYPPRGVTTVNPPPGFGKDDSQWNKDPGNPKPPVPPREATSLVTELGGRDVQVVMCN